MNKDYLKNYINTLPNEFKGKLKGFPKIVVAAMVIEQYNQGNKPDYTVFEKDHTAGEKDKGFIWRKSKQKSDFWAEVIWFKKFKYFIENYKPEPKFKDIFDDFIKQEYGGELTKEVVINGLVTGMYNKPTQKLSIINMFVIRIKEKDIDEIKINIDDNLRLRFILHDELLTVIPINLLIKEKAIKEKNIRNLIKKQIKNDLL